MCIWELCLFISQLHVFGSISEECVCLGLCLFDECMCVCAHACAPLLFLPLSSHVWEHVWIV